MKCYVTSRFNNAITHKSIILSLCDAVDAAGHTSVSFIRDVEKFDPHHFSTQQQVWSAALALLRECDCLLIDVSDAPSGGRNVEVGMGYALNMPIYVIVKNGLDYKPFYDGVASKVIRYDTYEDVARELATTRTKVEQP
ncbi:MAG TPA: nucleoside 2-deoxyribosyltransferase [Candidatus Saccharimonas sp.]|nr:nucleoside 2-deoxyribosyltransferase [Candidatus Saccharimonas sp.]